MKKWQEKRNYRRIKDEHGHIIKNIITVDGVDVEVSEEVFLSYSQMERRERYITEEVEPGRLLSLERLLEDGVPLELLGGEQEKSAEYTVFDQMDKMNIDRESQLIFALSNLDPCEKQLLWALYLEGVSAREYACICGVSDMAIRKRRDTAKLAGWSTADQRRVPLSQRRNTCVALILMFLVFLPETCVGCGNVTVPMKLFPR